MKNVFNIQSNNITFKGGDSLLISFSTFFKNLSTINSIDFIFSPIESIQSYHDIDIRWSYDVSEVSKLDGKRKSVWSAWEPIYRNANKVSQFDNLISKILEKSDSIDLQFRLVRRGSIDGPRSLDKIVIDFDLIEKSENISDLYPSSDPCKVTVCPTPDFSCGISLSCDKDLLFSPYDMASPAVKLWGDMSCHIGEMFGHCVRYFRTKPKPESADVVLKEFSIYDVVDVKDIKIIFADNRIPEDTISYIPFDQDFSEGFEIHIIKEHFERAFGQNEAPAENDYMYIPLLDRIYEIHSSHPEKGFMGKSVYYKAMLYKWQDKSNVLKDEPIEEYIESITKNFEETLRPEIEKEYIDVTKPQQYQTFSIGNQDKIRSHINENLSIVDRDIVNYFTVVAKYFYDLGNGINWGDLAVNYKLTVNRLKDKNTGFSMWFKTTRTRLREDQPTYDILLEGYTDSVNSGFRISLLYEENQNPNIVKSEKIRVQINEQIFDFDIGPLESDKWYGLVINQLNEFSQVSLHLWEILYNQNNPTINKSTDLRLVYTNHFDYAPGDVFSGGTYQLRGGDLGITNIRVWDQSIEEEIQPKILNQYVVRDSRFALLVDNAISPLRLPNTFVR